MLIGLAATEYSHKDAAGTVTGFLGLFAYLGAALAGWPLAVVMQHYGWWGFFAVLTMASACVGLLLMPMMMAGISKRELQSAPPDN
jgi:MFS transporter, OPA family, sugar phosphate sensor protein UhpC